MDEEEQLTPEEMNTPVLPKTAEQERQPIQEDPYSPGTPTQFPTGAGEGYLQEQEDNAQVSMKETSRASVQQSMANSVIEYLADQPAALMDLWQNGRADHS